MAKHDIIVVGASAGGIEACCALLGDLPADLPASVFIVQHVGSSSELTDVLRRCGPLNVAVPADGETIRRARVYVAPGDHHLLLQDHKIKLSRGPRENLHRPSVDALFRSAARAHRARVIAVVLSGALDDGAAGAFAVKARGGMVIVQDPRTAHFPSMPENALRATQVDYCVPLTEIPALLVKLVQENTAMPKSKTTAGGKLSLPQNLPRAAAAPFVCPECSGPLFQDGEGPPGQLQCLVGHAFAPESLSEAHREALERALLKTMRMLQERAGVHRHLMDTKHRGPNGHLRERFQECADAADKDVALLRDILERI